MSADDSSNSEIMARLDAIEASTASRFDQVLAELADLKAQLDQRPAAEDSKAPVFLCVKSAAQRAGVSVATVQRWAASFGIGIFVPPVWIIDQAKLDGHVEGRRRRNAAPAAKLAVRMAMTRRGSRP